VSGGSISASGIAATVGALTATTVSATGVILGTGSGFQSLLNTVDVRLGAEVFSAGRGSVGTLSNHPFDIYSNSVARVQFAATGAANFQGNAVSVGALTATTVTGTGLFLTPASASGAAGLRLPHGTAPSSPTDGDMWTTTAGLYVRINGGTVGPLT